jgi:IS30 family transposase
MSQEHDTTKRRTFNHLSDAERKLIEKHLRNGMSVHAIAKCLCRDKHTIRREIQRGTVVQRKQNPYASRNPKVPDYIDEKVYCWDAGKRAYDEHRKNCGNRFKLAQCQDMIEYVEGKILGEGKGSPDAAIGYACENKCFDRTFCTRTSYNYVELGLCKVKAIDLLLKVRRKPASKPRERKKKLGRSIDERLPVVAKRSEFGHWEGDSIIGKDGKSQVLTLVERISTTGYIFPASSHTSDKIVCVLNELQARYGEKFSRIFKTITFDNGTEFSSSKEMEGDGRTKVYYAHPYSSFERGTNENWNGIVRRFLPKGTDLSALTADTLNRIAHSINTLPRKWLNYHTPLDLWDLYIQDLSAA